MGQAIQAQCTQLNKVSDFQSKAIDLNDISAVIDFSSPGGLKTCINFLY